jgi:hypothetical protein
MIDEVIIMNRIDNFDLSFFENGKMFKSSDGEYVYKMGDIVTVNVDIFDKELNSLASREWDIDQFKKQLKNGSIVEYMESTHG